MRTKILQGGGRVLLQCDWGDTQPQERALVRRLSLIGMTKGDTEFIGRAKSKTNTIFCCSLAPQRELAIDYWLCSCAVYDVGVSIALIKRASYKQRLKWMISIEGFFTGRGAHLEAAANKAYTAWLRAGRPISGTTLAQTCEEGETDALESFITQHGPPKD